MRNKHTLVLFFENKGMKLRTWAISKGLSEKDTSLLYKINDGDTQGKYGRAKELKELLIKEGFGKALEKIEKRAGRDSTKDLKKGF